MLEQLHTRLRGELGYEEPITTLFQYPTIEMLAEYLSSSTSQAGSAAPTSGGPGERKKSGPVVDIRAQAKRRRGAFGMKNKSDDSE